MQIVTDNLSDKHSEMDNKPAKESINVEYLDNQVEQYPQSNTQTFRFHSI